MINQNVTALIVVDVQRAAFTQRIKIFKENELIHNINSLIDAFHNKGIQVYFIRHSNRTTLVENSEGWQIHPELHLHASDILVNKRHMSAFREKNLQSEFNKAGIKHIVITGLVTQGCVQAACQDGHKHGYEVTLSSDAHSTFDRDAENAIAELHEKMAAEGINIVKACDILEQ